VRTSGTELDVLQLVNLVLAGDKHHAFTRDVVLRLCHSNCFNSKRKNVSFTEHFRLALESKARVSLLLNGGVFTKEVVTEELGGVVFLFLLV
jgi:hypothetical protein